MDTKPMKILIIEDDLEDCNNFIECAKTREDVEIIGITDSDIEGIRETKIKHPDGIVLDLELNNSTHGNADSLNFITNLKKLNLNYRTISKYIELLRRLNLIILARPKYEKGAEKGLQCYYALYEDYQSLRDFVNETGKKYHIEYYKGSELAQDEIDGLHLRKYIAKYTWMKRGKEYPLEEVAEIKKAIEWYNKRNLEYYNRCIEEGVECELVQKNMSVFKKYDLSEYEDVKPKRIFDLDTFNPESSVGS